MPFVSLTYSVVMDGVVVGGTERLDCFRGNALSIRDH